MMSVSASSSPAKSRRRSGAITSPTFFSSSSSSTFTLICNHHSLSSLITLDHLLLLLTLLSCSFLVISSFSHILYSIYLFLPPLLPIILSPIPILIAVFLFLILAIFFISLEFTCPRRTKCGRPKCKGLRDAVEFDVKVQTEEGVRAGIVDEVWREIGELPWKGGGQGDNPDYECVRKELRRMAPPNGRAVLLFRARCGCPLAKLEGWGTKRGKRHKNLQIWIYFVKLQLCLARRLARISSLSFWSGKYNKFKPG